MSPSKGQRYLADRVSSIEAHNLDNELEHTIDNVVDKFELPILGDELKTVIKIYLYYHNLGRNATTGMRACNLELACLSNSESVIEPLSGTPSRYKLILLAASNIIGPYITKKSCKLDLALRHGYTDRLNLPWLTLDNAVAIYKSLSVFNFIVFLKTGRYLTLPERIFGIAPSITDQGYSRNVMLNGIQIDYIYRDRIWQSFAEFLTIVIPFINVLSIKNKIARFIGVVPGMQSQLSISAKLERESNARTCAICMKQPFNPHVIGCRHVFCYYCIHAKYMTDPHGGYSCRTCNYSTSDETNVSRYKILTALE